MLAQNFKTAADLKITDAEFDALHKVLGMLERNEMKHAKSLYPRTWSDRGYRREDAFSGLFNMRGFAETAECGTVLCIAGTCDLVFGTNFAPRFWGDHPEKLPGMLSELFAPDDMTIRQMENVQPQEAAIALRNYLTHGDPRWAEACAE